ncbi:hypothetical protein BaRGS_00001275, partial [Batillaria attramentaria]
MAGTGSVVWVLALLPFVACNLVIYPSASGAPKSNKFQVFLTQNGNRHESHVYISTSDRRSHEASHVKPGRSMSWTSFAFSGAKVTVEVHAPQDFHNCIVAKFDVPSNTKMMSVEFDYDYGTSGHHDITDKLMVFADPPETHKPNKNDNHVLYYDVGVHNLNGQKDIGAKTEVYLAPGAFVKGGFKTSQNHAMDKGSHHTIEGVTISESMGFFFRALSDSCTVRNIKTVGAWINNNDGIATGDNGVVQDCFIHANDDAIKIYSDGMHVSRCVVWQGLNGAVFQTGWYSGRDMQHVQVTDVDVIHTDWCTFKGNDCSTSQNNAVFDQAGDTSSFHVSDIEFRNIRVEGNCPRVIFWK